MTPGNPAHIAQLTEHLFRREHGRMVAVLSRIFGLHNLELVEDMVQEAFGKAIEDWGYRIPDNPGAWLMQVARNKCIDILRRQRHQTRLSTEFGGLLESGYTAHYTLDQLFLDHEIADSQLRMVFACCHPSLSAEDQILLTLRACSGFGVEEAAHAMLMPYEVAKKRIQRAKAALKAAYDHLPIPSGAELGERLDIALRVLYLMFNEGYKSSTHDAVIRRDLCQEAMRLCLLLTDHALTRHPQTLALLALMCLQAARFDARLDAEGEIVLLEHQDRRLWDRELMEIGVGYLDQSAFGEVLSTYHLQAAIAVAHMQAPSFEETDWALIHRHYELLAAMDPSPMALLNKAIVRGKLGEAREALADLELIPGYEALLERNYLFAATRAELHRTLGELAETKHWQARAVALAPTEAERRLMERK